MILYAFMGWVVGVAVNHAADILPTRQTLLQWPRCAACRAARPYLTWSVILAILTKQSRCAACGERLSNTLTRSIIVELSVPVVFAFLINRYGLSLELFLISIYTVILILITVTDLEHRLIFNVVVLPAILFALAAAFFTPGLAWPSALVGGGGAFLVMYLAALLSRGGLGEGDVTLSTFLGLILGFPLIILSIGFGVFLGGFIVLLLLMTRRVRFNSFVPYGPFLTSTGWVMLIWGDKIWQYYFY